MDLRKLKTLIDLVSESNISELEITEADGKVRIVKADLPAENSAAVFNRMQTERKREGDKEAKAAIARSQRR